MISVTGAFVRYAGYTIFGADLTAAAPSDRVATRAKAYTTGGVRGKRGCKKNSEYKEQCAAQRHSKDGEDYQPRTVFSSDCHNPNFTDQSADSILTLLAKVVEIIAVLEFSPL